MNIFKLEPALVTGFIAAVIGLAVAFGAPITGDQKVQIMGFVGAALAMGAALVTRANVTPTATVNAPPVAPPKGP